MNTKYTLSASAAEPAHEGRASGPFAAATPRSPLTDEDLYLFNEGTHYRVYDKLGAKLVRERGASGVWFSVWAPDASRVTVMGDFNLWDKDNTPLKPRGSSGVWEGFVPGVTKGTRYKFHVTDRHGWYRVDKADPFGLWHEVPPHTASVVWDLDYDWGDGTWMQTRRERNALHSPMSIYEVHIGSFMRSPNEGHRPLTYRELAPRLVDYVSRMGFTHVEFMPVMEHPFYGSWGYQVSGYFAPTSRYGTPQDFMFLVDQLHQHGIGVILDWVPAHFPTDSHALGFFDGEHLYEHADPRKGFHPDWRSFIFNYGRHEVKSFLVSSAMFWLDKYHVDGLRVDGVASMLYLDYSRNDGEWIPNEYGGRENLEALSFLRTMNEAVYSAFPDVQTIAEESTAWPMVSRPTYCGGLGFGLKWDMGWMHDTLRYMARDCIYRKYHQNELTFRSLYANHENFVLPLSHDEVVHGKGSLLGKMPGDEWQKFANLRLLFAYMYALPAKKLLFMGGEFAQWNEWYHEVSLDWHLTQYERHRGVQELVAHLNHVYRAEPALHRLDVDPRGFYWIDAGDADNSVLLFARQSESGDDTVLTAFNFTPGPLHNYRVGVPFHGFWREIVNSDAKEYGGSGHGNMGGVDSNPVPWQGQPFSINVTLPPLGACFFRGTRP